MMILDYILAKECKNPEVWYTCLKCGKCGRVFNEYGFMIDTGGTHLVGDDENGDDESADSEDDDP